MYDLHICVGVFGYVTYFLEAITFNSFVGRGVRNICESEQMKRRAQYARDRFDEAYQRHFASDCQMKSLLARLNRCSREYFNSIFGGVENMSFTGAPIVKFDIKPELIQFAPGFVGKYGGRDNSEVFQSFRDSFQGRFPSIVIPEADLKYDTCRMVLGAEFRMVIVPILFHFLLEMRFIGRLL